MNDLEIALSAVRVLHDQREPNLDARRVALHALRQFACYHTPANEQPYTSGPVDLSKIMVGYPHGINPNTIGTPPLSWTT